MITTAAVSLNEFVDSMLVSNLLGSEALAIINIGVPVMLTMSAVSVLFGDGGATAYAIAEGNRDHDTAGKSFTGSMVAALAAGLLLFLCVAITGPIAGALCSDPDLIIPFTKYLTILFISSPFIVVTLTAACFLPSAGYPKLAMILNVIANVINIIMDYAYIRFFHMGVEGAAYATMTGYICAALVMLIALLRRRVKLYVCRDIAGSLKVMNDVFRFGMSEALNQLGLGIQFAVINSLAMSIAGSAGVVAFSLCMQANSIISVFVGAVIGASVPLLAVLHGQRDYKGEAGILKTSLIWTFAISVAGTAFFILFASQTAALYNITKTAELALSITALRIYSLSLIPRCVVVVYYRYLKVIGLTVYASVLSALDSFVLIILLAYTMSIFMGITGLWFAFPLSAAVLLLVTLVCNLYFAPRSGGRLNGPLLIEHDEDVKPVMDVTISGESEDISAISGKLQEICLDLGMDTKDAVLASLAVEEIAVNASARLNSSSYSDVLVRINHGCVEIDFRTLGKSFDPMEENDERLHENMLILKNISSKIEHDYILGMNSTRITLEGR